MHYIIFCVICSIWSGMFILMKKAGFAFGPLTIGALGTMGGALILAGFWFTSKAGWQYKKRHITPLLLIAFLGYAWPFSIQPFLINKIGHGYIGMMVALVPFLTILLSIPILKIFPSRTQLIGVLVGMCCMILMMLDGLDRRIEPFYLLLATSVPLSYAISNTLVQKSFKDIPAVPLATILMAISSIFLIPFALIFETITVNESFYFSLLSLGIIAIIGRGAAVFLFYKLIKLKGALFAGMVTYVIPVGALFWSWVDNESLTTMQILAVVIILLMVGMVQRNIVKQEQKLNRCLSRD